MLNLSLKTDRDKLEQLIAEDVDNFCVQLYGNENRNHLGASELGEQCWRKLYYKFRWFKKPSFDGRMLRLFNVGHTAEPRFISYLRGIGFEIKEFEQDTLNYNPDDHSYFWSVGFKPEGLLADVTNLEHHKLKALELGIKPNQWRISGAKGHYGGSLDGQCIAPERYNLETGLVLLNEFKTNNTGKGYAAVADQELSKAKPKHYAQCCQYGAKYKLKYALYMIENKNDSDITFRIIELDWNYGKSLERKAEEIIFATEPPPRIAENESFFDCKYCDDFKGICHRGEQPEKNCRTCRQSTPVDNAQWHCSRFNDIIPPEFVKTGCDDWNAI